jgi:hypothetical protein
MITTPLCKIKEYHGICVKMKKLKNTSFGNPKYIEKIELILPEIKKKYSISETTISKKNFYKKQVELYFLQNANKFQMYKEMKKNVTVTKAIKSV